MATKQLTPREIALTEKKMDMTLDDIIKMSKNKDPKAKKQQRAPNKNQKFQKNYAQEKALKVRRYMDSRSSVRQGALAQRRSNFQGNQFSLTNEAARRAVVAPIHNRAFNRSMVVDSNKPRVGALAVHKRAVKGAFVAKQPEQQQHQGNGGAKQRPQTLDSLFANMKEQRMRVLSRQNNGALRNGGTRPRVPWARGRFGN